MTKLPEKTLLDGSKLPKTTTGEMKDALGSVHDFLEELLGTDSSDTEAARKKLGIDLPEILAAIDASAKREEVERLEEEMGKQGVPVGTIAWFAMGLPPEG